MPLRWVARVNIHSIMHVFWIDSHSVWKNEYPQTFLTIRYILLNLARWLNVSLGYCLFSYALIFPEVEVTENTWSTFLCHSGPFGRCYIEHHFSHQLLHVYTCIWTYTFACICKENIVNEYFKIEIAAF